MYDLNQKRTVSVKGRVGSFVSFLISLVHDRRVLLLYDNDDEAFITAEEIEYYTGAEVHIFPPYAHKIFEKEDEGKRTRFLYHLLSDDRFIGLFPYNALSRSLPSPHRFSSHEKTIRPGETVFQEDLLEYLDRGGYEIGSLVVDTGQFAKRGSIIDVFPPSYEKPVRIEFDADQIFSIRLFDPGTQRSLSSLNKCNLTSATSSEPDDISTLRDYVNADIAVVHGGIQLIQHQLAGVEFRTLRDSWAELLNTTFNIDLSDISPENTAAYRAVSNEDLQIIFREHKTELFGLLTERFNTRWSHYSYVYVVANSEHQAKRLQEIFGNHGISLPVLPRMSFQSTDREWGIITGPLRRGFRTDDILVLTEEDIVGRKKRTVKKKWNGPDEFLTSFKDLSPGEWVVHVEHGIGIYRGITPLRINGHVKDFITIEYQDTDKLYVPVNDLQLVHKFIGSEKTKPKIDKLGSALWSRTKRRVKKQIEDIAKDLLSVHAERQLTKGYSYGPEDEIFREMESRFEFEETEGQLKAIDEVLADMRSSRPMDRLVCGDVGFGKTEVALRAAFRAVLDNKQVAMLAPTTILSQQHFETFRERLNGYPVNIDILSRFRTRDEQSGVVESVRKGSTDIVIGTHRLLQKDIGFKDLGLLIIDEEQRFGVKHKEKLKTLKKDIDVLTLSATPIPRTLYMATMGIKDLSIIDTPPLDRLAVKTYVVQFNERVIRKAVLDELQRGGQVFFVHNFVHNIGVVFEDLSRILPQARIAIAHGQMDGRKLEKVMSDFIEKRYDVLLSTNIIESGLDISNVNTILINNAHRMGLSDLYQLRGRVGRSEKQAYAYLLVPKTDRLTRDATLRLRIIEELAELGSGFHVANYDLEIRGAGNLLGKEQSGNVNLIGFELYCTMLEEAMQELKNIPHHTTDEITTEIVLPLDAFIPDDYISDTSQKLLMYKRLSAVREEQELLKIREELRDRYGVIPLPLINLLEIISLKCFLSALHVKKIELSGKQLVIHISDRTPLDMKKVIRATGDPVTRLKLMPDGRIVIRSDIGPENLSVSLRKLLKDIISL